MRPLRHRIPLLPLLAGLLLAVSIGAGCGFGTENAGGGEGEPETEGITLYSGRIAAALGGANDAYEADSDTDVEVRYAASADLGAQIVEEGENSPADAFFAQEFPAMGAVEDAGLLAELPDDVLEMVPPEYRDPEGRWVGVTGRARTVAYNSDVLSPADLPENPLDFTEPEWEGRVGWAPITGSFQEYMTQVRLAYGDEAARDFLQGMVDNGVTAYPNNVALRDAIANGEIDAGLINHYYVAQAIAQEGDDYPVELFYPKQGLGSTVLLTTIGVLEGSDRKEEAFDYVRFMLNDESQSFFTTSSKEYPLVPGVKRDPSLELPLAKIPAPPSEPLDLAELQQTVELMEETGAL
ncbi:extracellular solute-binding protein [Thermoleophilia bacterium SCSIO 60948]|nr:extracellular solute-binding protein [Thermoleophilia bacterium SCSIO 60948]